MLHLRNGLYKDWHEDKGKSCFASKGALFLQMFHSLGKVNSLTTGPQQSLVSNERQLLNFEISVFYFLVSVTNFLP